MVVVIVVVVEEVVVILVAAIVVVLVYVRVLAAIAIENYCVPPKNNQFKNIFYVLE